MDDDDLILNFAPPPANGPPPARVQKVVGGSWRDRQDMRLKLQGRERKHTTGVNSMELKKNRKFDEMTGLREQADKMMKETFPRKKEQRDKNQNNKRDGGDKRDRRERDGDKRDGREPESDSKRTKFAETSGERGGKNATYVSSLFTARNQATLQESVVDNTVHQPSNAPLRDNSTFEGMGLEPKLATHLTTAMKYVAPTKVQRSVVPEILSSQNDLFVKAQTGSGKTLAFALPIINQLVAESSQITRQSGLFALILTPTRELAQQIYSVLEAVLRCHHHIVPGIVVGGEKKKSEKARIRKGVNILVATPGRLADHLENTESLDTSQVRWLVLDEGDRLVELGFQETITNVTDHLARTSKIGGSQYTGLPSRRVNILCSATMPEDVKKLGSTVLEKPKMISVDRGVSENFASAPDQLVQKVMVVPPKLRLVTLAAALKSASTEKETPESRTMVFFSCSDSVDYHYDIFSRGGLPIKQEKTNDDEETKPQTCASTAPGVDSNTLVFRLHGSLSQQLRTSTLQQFVQNDGKNKGKHLVLFCTDVASRGLDLPNIANVIEYDPPFSVDDHLHRIGRSARVGNKGEATLFLLPGDEEGYVEGKLRVVHPKKSNLRVVGYESLLEKSFGEEEDDEKKERKSRKDDKKDAKHKEGKWDIHATTWHLEVERWLLEDSAALDKASNAFISHIRAYATHLSAERMYFNVKTLHLGHLAKAFGLRETPKKLGRSSGSHAESKKKEDPRKKMLRMARKTEKASASEFNY